MIPIDLLPPNQERTACHALLGDPPSQRTVLEMAVKLADAGVESIGIFKEAALHSLREALKANMLPPRPDARKKGADGDQFVMAAAWWKAKLTGKRYPTKATALQLATSAPAINRARKRHGDLSGRPDMAKERALFDLAWNGRGGPDIRWIKEWERCREELRKPLGEILKTLPPEAADLLRKAVKL
jgi:hypothetical protein